MRGKSEKADITQQGRRKSRGGADVTTSGQAPEGSRPKAPSLGPERAARDFRLVSPCQRDQESKKKVFEYPDNEESGGGSSISERGASDKTSSKKTKAEDPRADLMSSAERQSRRSRQTPA